MAVIAEMVKKKKDTKIGQIKTVHSAIIRFSCGLNRVYRSATNENHFKNEKWAFK